MPIPEFVLALRSRVGTSPLWLSGVSAVVLDDRGHVLLTRRADNGMWALVSGILEPGEEPAPAALREIAEETGLDAEIIRLTSVDVTEPITYPNGDVTQYIDHTFRCVWVSGEPHPADGENTHAAWFRTDGLPELGGEFADRVAVALANDPECRLGPLR